MKKKVVSMVCGLMLVSFIELPIAEAHDSARIAELEQRIQALEELLGSVGDEVKTTIAGTSKGNWTEPNSWERLKDGMSFSQVESILGKPTINDLSSSGDSGKWYYGVVGGLTISGNVFFSSRQLLIVSKPVF